MINFVSSVILFGHQAAVCTCHLLPLDPQVGSWVMRFVVEVTDGVFAQEKLS